MICIQDLKRVLRREKVEEWLRRSKILEQLFQCNVVCCFWPSYSKNHYLELSTYDKWYIFLSRILKVSQLCGTRRGVLHCVPKPRLPLWMPLLWNHIGLQAGSLPLLKAKGNKCYVNVCSSLSVLELRPRFSRKMFEGSWVVLVSAAGWSRCSRAMIQAILAWVVLR